MDQSIQNAVLIQNMTAQELEKIVERAVSKKMKAIGEQQNKVEKNEKIPNFYKRIETAKKLGISMPTLNEWTKLGIIKCHRIGYRVYYTEEDILVAMGLKGIATQR